MTDSHSHDRRANLRGIGFMLFAVAMFAALDAALKVLAAHYPPMQVAAVRGLSSLPIVLVWALATVPIAGLAVLGTALAYAISALTVRVLPRSDSTQAMVLWMTALLALGAGALALPDWHPLQWEHALPIGLMAVAGSLGQYAVTEAFRHGEASVVAPFEYTALLWGIALDALL